MIRPQSAKIKGRALEAEVRVIVIVYRSFGPHDVDAPGWSPLGWTRI